MNWTSESDQILLKLRSQNMRPQRVNWIKISSQFSKLYKLSVSPKQCRDRYQNYAKYKSNTEQSPLLLQWSQQQLQILKLSYMQLGSSWMAISLKLKKKTQNQIKNKFYSLLRKTVEIIVEKTNQTQKKKNCISVNSVIILLDLSNRIEKWASENGYTFNKDSRVYKIKCILVDLCFEEISEYFIESLIQNIRFLCFRLKSCWLFKVSNRKSWKITPKFLTSFLSFDNFINQPLKFEGENVGDRKANDSNSECLTVGYPYCNQDGQKNLYSLINESEFFQKEEKEEPLQIKQIILKEDNLVKQYGFDFLFSQF